MNNLATQYRPKVFAEVAGQQVAVSVLKRIAHADGITCRSIFLKGAWGAGKTTLARIFAKALNCSEFVKADDVCNECSSCMEASSPNSQTYLEFDATTAGNVDNIRALHERLSFLPPHNLRRLVVIDEIHAASNAALNALLKLVEDGVPNTIFMFCSTEDILPTIKSRSLCLDIEPIAKHDMVPRLQYVADKESIKVTPQILDLIADKSQGHMRDALSTLQLYHLAGEEAIHSPFKLLEKFIILCLKHKTEDANIVLQEMLLYPVTDISSSIATFIKAVYIATPDSPLYQLLSKGVAPKLFSFFYTPLAQQALKSESGTELLFRTFLDKCNG